MKIDVRGQEMEVAEEDVSLVQSALAKIDQADPSKAAPDDKTVRGAPDLTGREREVLQRYWRQRFNK